MTPHCVAEGVLDDLGEEDLGEEVLGEVDDLGPGLDSWLGLWSSGSRSEAVESFRVRTCALVTSSMRP